MKRNILLSIALGGMLLTGCNDDFLTPKTLSIFTTDNVLVNEEGFDAALTSCSSLVRDEYYDHMAPILAELVFSDVAVMGSEGANIPVDLFNPPVTSTKILRSVPTGIIGGKLSHVLII